MNTTEPYSPIARAKPSVAPESSAGHSAGKITFMKVVDGNKLDPKDSYDSEYVGSDEKKALTKLGGDGTPVVGITGKANDKDLTGFGIVLIGQEPKKK